jgi:O-antigen/teichoic acid export membrane protein
MLLSTLYTVGLYGPAVFVGVTFFLLLASIDQALVPLTSRIYGKHGTANFKYLAARASRFLLLFYFPLGFAIAASSPTLVTLIMGERFADSGYPIIIIVVAITLTSPGILVNTLLRSAGYTGVALKASVVALMVQILISLIMIPQVGMIGASAARFVAYFVLVIPLIYKLKRIGGFDFDRTALKYGLVGSGIISLEIVGISMLFAGPFSLIIQYTMAFLSYLFLLRYTRSLTRKDFELIDKTFMGKIKWLTAPLAKLLLIQS